VKLTIKTMGVYLTCGPNGSDPRPSGQRGWLAGPTPWPADEGLTRFGPSLGCHASTQGGEARVIGGPIDPYKYPPPLTVKVEEPHSTCSSPLVKVSVICLEDR
jgi:hypothetical protein